MSFDERIARVVPTPYHPLQRSMSTSGQHTGESASPRGVGPEQLDGAVVDDDPRVALVVLDP